MKKHKTGMTIDKDVYDNVKEEAEKQGRSFSSMVNKVLKDWLKNLSKGKNKA